MKILRHHHSVVRVHSRRAGVWRGMLTAVSLGSALAGTAGAQSLPGEPSLLIDSTIRLTHGTEVEKTYTVEQSFDFAPDSWMAVGETRFGDGTDKVASVPVSLEFSKSSFFRLKVESRPETGIAPWSLPDRMFLLNTTGGVRTMAFLQEGGGVFKSASATDNFTWTWLRTGADTGVCVVALPGGESETLNFRFLADGTGVFSSERTKEDVPSGASFGTFRQITDASLTTQAPGSLGHSFISLSGTGRPVGIEVKEDGTAVSTHPLGSVQSTCAYLLKDQLTGELKLNASLMDSETYTLNFTGPSCGTYVFRARKSGTLRREATGTFTISPR